MTILLNLVLSNLRILVGRLHPLVVHLPIGILLLLALFAWLAAKERYATLRPAVGIMAFWGMISSICSCIAGYLLSETGGYEGDQLTWHKWLGIALAIWATVFYLVKKFEFNLKYFQQFSIPALLILLTATGHYGGALTHGEDFLNQPILALLGKAPDKTEPEPITDINQALVYQDVVEPILAQKCFQCHNEQKKKGGLRMDTAELLLKGGEHGQILLAGNTAESELFKRLVLPEDDEKRMPPKGKAQLNEQEIALLDWWIRTGAAMDKKVSMLPTDQKIEPILAHLQMGAGGPMSKTMVEEKSEFSAEKINNPHPKDVLHLTALNVSVDRIGPENGWVSINTVNYSDFNDSEIKLLLPVKKQVTWLKLKDTKVTDNALPIVGQLPNLTRLNLENTNVGDEGLKSLKTLPRLQYLSLVGTNVTDNGLEDLQIHKNLRRVYLWKSKVTLAGITKLQAALPGCQINLGEVLQTGLTSKE